MPMPSRPNRNMVHVVLLTVWAAVGLVVTLSAFAHPAIRSFLGPIFTEFHG